NRCRGCALRALAHLLDLTRRLGLPLELFELSMDAESGDIAPEGAVGDAESVRSRERIAVVELVRLDDCVSGSSGIGVHLEAQLDLAVATLSVHDFFSHWDGRKPPLMIHS